MDSATQDLFYQRIYELVYDEDKIITCPSLACELKISLEEAKTLLMKFVSDKRELNKLTEFCVSYLISGSLKENKGLALYLVKEEDLNEKKNLFKNISSEIIFSIQKNKPVDFNTIACINKTAIDANPDVCLASFVSRDCIKRTIKPQNLPLKQEVAPLKEKKSWFQQNSSSNAGLQKTTSSQELPHEKQAKVQRTNSSQELSQGKQTKIKKAGNITNFFSKSTAKTIENVKSERTEEKIKNETTSPKNELRDAKSEASINASCNGVMVEKENLGEKMEVEYNDVKPVEDKPKSKSAGKKRKKDNKSEAPNKKRKRIQEICDSDSSDIFEEEKDEDIIEKSDEEPEPVPKSQPLPKKKIRKAVDKTYVDDEGYMVTSTEYIYESAPEDEEIEVVKSCNKEEPKMIANKKNSTTDSETDMKNQKTKGKKNNKNTTGKQTTLMSFFKKN